jgi:hypothetical protein
LNVAVDQADMEITTPDRNIRPDMGGITGRSFEMTVSPQGEEIDTSDAEALTFTLREMSGKRINIAADFQTLFPDLPAHPVVPGDAWTSEDTLTIDAGDATVVAQLATQNTLLGYETVDGMRCARVRTSTHGRLEGTGEDEGKPVTIEGTVDGTGLWHFAPDPGVFVRMESQTRADGTVTVQGPATTIVPLRQTSEIDVALATD